MLMLILGLIKSDVTILTAYCGFRSLFMSLSESGAALWGAFEDKGHYRLFVKGVKSDALEFESG
ncbi:MAG: hypothetical protein ACJAWL_001837 [Motiliproteus sp.]|jgi:hypothetical protein